MSSFTIPTNIQEQAADWVVQLSYGSELERSKAKERFEAWQALDPRNAAAAERVLGVFDQLAGVRSVSGGQARPVRAALEIEKKSLRKHGKQMAITLALLVAFALPTWTILQNYPVSYMTADMRSTTGEWREHTLEDGSRIVLRNASAVNLRFDASKRILEVVQGEVLVDIAKDTTRPFLIETKDGEVRALGTRVIVDKNDDETVVTMLESAVSVRTWSQREHNGEGKILHAGQRIRIKPESLSSIEQVDADSINNAWKYHQLVAHNRPLADVLDEIDRQRPGRIFYNKQELSGINVAVVTPLENTDHALQLLANSLPALRVRTFSPYLVQVDLQPDSTSKTAR